MDSGGHAADLLRLRAARLDRRDAALASEIVLGVLRYRAQLDFLVEHFSGHNTAKFDAEVVLILRAAIYQLRYLDRVPRHAAVNESVGLVKRAHKRSAAGLVNAVLRKVHRDPVLWPNRATQWSHPEWLLASWERQFGKEAAEAIAATFLHPPATYVRLPEGPQAEPGLKLEPTELDGCYRVLRGEPAAHRIQDIGSQSIVPLLELEEGMTFLDLCAAPGNKTAQALESKVKAVACDVRSSRLRALEGLPVPLVVLDGTQPLPFARSFDRILVDAPCSGTGTLGRNPEIKWRLKEEDLARHHHRQVGLLRNALASLKSGGRLVYSTCSLEPEENDKTVQAVLAGAPTGARLESQHSRVPGRDAGDGFFAAVITSD